MNIFCKNICKDDRNAKFMQVNKIEFPFNSNKIIAWYSGHGINMFLSENKYVLKEKQKERKKNKLDIRTEREIERGR